MKSKILVSLILIASLCSCTKNDGEDDDRKIVIPPHPAAAIASDSAHVQSDGEDDDRKIIIKP